MEKVQKTWKKYFYEFLVIFVSVSLAFALAKWNENKNRQISSEKTLLEIRNGLDYDINDFNLNMAGHQKGLVAVDYFRKYLRGEELAGDSVGYQMRRLFASFISIQNNSGYESLKSKGLDLIDDDSLRLEIISLYDMDYEILIKLEEEDSESQFHENYYSSFIDILAEYIIFDEDGKLMDIAAPINITKKERNILMSHLRYIETIKMNLIRNYVVIEENARKLTRRLDRKL